MTPFCTCISLHVFAAILVAACDVLQLLQAMCRYADGKNAETGVDTRSSLGCGSRRRFRDASPSSPEGPQVTEEQKKDFVQSMPVYRH